ncbi:hypothetical protein FDG2_5371 [Candidatus Protofrankia californiensis]|uniref:Uncharacterized protein n=1 Tax=Candidatus Protofrankia californiensis TaxID=1839754 RepID=A0A1C3PCR6_9ACTN|nr:hypothetical protein FDG2_5371 [Candidatus Protofrankia californiensis]
MINAILLVTTALFQARVVLPRQGRVSACEQVSA